MIHIKTEEAAIKNTRESIAKLLSMLGNAANGKPSKRVSFTFQNAISQIPDATFKHLLKNPNARLRIQILKPKPDDQSHGRRNKR